MDGIRSAPPCSSPPSPLLHQKPEAFSSLKKIVSNPTQPPGLQKPAAACPLFRENEGRAGLSQQPNKGMRPNHCVTVGTINSNIIKYKFFSNHQQKRRTSFNHPTRQRRTTTKWHGGGAHGAKNKTKKKKIRKYEQDLLNPLVLFHFIYFDQFAATSFCQCSCFMCGNDGRRRCMALSLEVRGCFFSSHFYVVFYSTNTGRRDGT